MDDLVKALMARKAPQQATADPMVQALAQQQSRTPAAPQESRPVNMGDFSNLNFVQRIMDPNRASISNADGSKSTHRMAAEVDEQGNWFVFPTIVQMPNGELKQFGSNREAMDYAIKTGEIIPFNKDKSKALSFAEGGYKAAAPDGMR